MVVDRCVRYLEQKTRTEGLFRCVEVHTLPHKGKKKKKVAAVASDFATRVAGSTLMVDRLRSEADEGLEMDFSSADPHSVASLLKTWCREYDAFVADIAAVFAQTMAKLMNLRRLPDPIIPYDMYDQFLQVFVFF